MPRRRSLAGTLAVAAVATLLGAEPSAAARPAQEAECPAGLVCRFIPAAYAQTDPGVYGNYDRADRPRDGDDIRYLVVHDTEESYDSAIARFQDPHNGACAHYVIRSSDGQVTQLVHTRNIAHHAGNYWFNMHSLGIEHEGV
ncbi:MAG: N-acetylmuramoyl-L-alanine amidase, partial [Pseudonocardiaceae bacterium]